MPVKRFSGSRYFHKVYELKEKFEDDWKNCTALPGDWSDIGHSDNLNSSKTHENLNTYLLQPCGIKNASKKHGFPYRRDTHKQERA